MVTISERVGRPFSDSLAIQSTNHNRVSWINSFSKRILRIVMKVFYVRTKPPRLSSHGQSLDFRQGDFEDFRNDIHGFHNRIPLSPQLSHLYIGTLERLTPGLQFATDPIQ
jgi:hypothetical protein